MSPPLKLVWMVTDYVRSAAGPVSTADVAAAITQGRTETAGGALVTARGRGYVERMSDGCWRPGPIELFSADDRRYRAQRKWFAHVPGQRAKRAPGSHDRKD
jgi:hypothetical protein